MSSTTHVPIDNTMGSMLIGTLVSAVLLGITYAQTLYYFLDYPKDSLYVKGLVISITLFDSVHTALISHTVYHYLVSNFNDTAALARLSSSVLIEVFFGGMLGFLVQCFFTLRIWRLSKNYFLTGIILLTAVSCMGCVFAWVILAMQMGTFVQLLTLSPLSIAINGLSAAADVLIATSLVILLHRARTGFKRSDTTINRLIIFIVNTGVLTSCVAIAALVSITISPTTLIYASFYFCLGRLYSNSFLATLNARKYMQWRYDEGTHMLMSMPPSVLSPSSGTTAGGGVQPNISIRIETSQVHDDLDGNQKSDDEKSLTDMENQKARGLY